MSKKSARRAARFANRHKSYIDVIIHRQDGTAMLRSFSDPKVAERFAKKSVKVPEENIKRVVIRPEHGREKVLTP